MFFPRETRQRIGGSTDGGVAGGGGEGRGARGEGSARLGTKHRDGLKFSTLPVCKRKEKEEEEEEEEGKSHRARAGTRAENRIMQSAHSPSPRPPFRILPATTCSDQRESETRASRTRASGEQRPRTERAKETSIARSLANLR